MSKPGSHDHAADRAARAAVDHGLSPLEAKVLVHVAGRGLDWQNDAEVAAELTWSNGRHPHRESVGRVRRGLAKRGHIVSRRLMPGAALPNRAKYGRTRAGTTLKHVVWTSFRIATPTPRGARTRERQRVRRSQVSSAPPSAAETLAAIAAARQRLAE